jgi:7-cyano-7-deazaguanine tRNA-ribosyltransferase
MLVVAGWNLKSTRPRVWDQDSPYYLPELKAIMVSYAEFYRMPANRRRAMDQGLHQFLKVPDGVKIFLDNGAFHFLSRNEEFSKQEYEEFVTQTNPDWYPIPQDYIPIPKMSLDAQRNCFQKTMQVNIEYQHNGYTPVIHVSQFLEQYAAEIKQNQQMSQKPRIALGGIVPNLLRASKALPYEKILKALQHVRQEFADKEMHVFGMGGTATLHIAALLGINSVDSSGWRARAARGLVQLPGTGDRSVANLGKWKGREPSLKEWKKLEDCPCPACQIYGLKGLKADKTEGFSNRATHNLWVLLEEANLIQQHLTKQTYADWYESHLDNTIYIKLIRQLVSEA